MPSTSQIIDEDPSSTDSSDSEGTYEMNDREEFLVNGEFELSIPLKEALDTLNTHLNNPGNVGEPAAVRT